MALTAAAALMVHAVTGQWPVHGTAQPHCMLTSHAARHVLAYSEREGRGGESGALIVYKDDASVRQHRPAAAVAGIVLTQPSVEIMSAPGAVYTHRRTDGRTDRVQC